MTEYINERRKKKKKPGTNVKTIDYLPLLSLKVKKNQSGLFQVIILHEAVSTSKEKNVFIHAVIFKEVHRFTHV